MIAARDRMSQAARCKKTPYPQRDKRLASSCGTTQFPGALVSTGLFDALTGVPGRAYYSGIDSARQLRGDVRQSAGTVSQRDNGSLQPGGDRLLFPFSASCCILI